MNDNQVKIMMKVSGMWLSQPELEDEFLLLAGSLTNDLNVLVNAGWINKHQGLKHILYQTNPSKMKQLFEGILEL